MDVRKVADRGAFTETYGKVQVQIYEKAPELMEKTRPEDQKILELLESGYDSRRGQENSWEVLYHLSHLRGNLTEWLPIGAEDVVLEFGADSGQLTGGFLKKAKYVYCLEESISRSRILAKRYQEAENLAVYSGNPWKNMQYIMSGASLGTNMLSEESISAHGGTNVRFDWIVAPGLLAEAERYFTGENVRAEAVRQLLTCLKPGGHLVLACDNRFGLKYWAGAMAPHTGRYFDSLEGNGCGCSKRELEQILEDCGQKDAVFYYPYPERWFPTAVYSDLWLPKKGELNQNLRNFEGERLLLFDEEKVYDQLIEEGRFPEFANAFLCITGPGEEEQTVYVKYSNDRAERFMIRTDIVKKADGFEVRKIPLSEAAEDHVRSMKNWEEILDRWYKKNHISANRCELRDNRACFEYLKGRTFEERLDELRAKRDYGGLAAELLGFGTLLRDTLRPELKPFEKSRVFSEMFGNPSFPKAYEGAPVNNLDWIFGNLMETEEGRWIIDYEWTFSVQVPVEYLLWRALSLYLNSREELKPLGLMAQAGITSEEEKCFAGMEHHFQLWLLEGTVTMGGRYLETAGRTLTLGEMMKTDRKNRIQVYEDTGNGYAESQSRWIITEPDKQGMIRLELLLLEGTRALRLDPAETACLVKVRRLLGELGGSYPLSYVHNGRELEEQGILYTTTDPQITIPEVVPGTSRIYAELTIEELYPDTAYACMNLLNRVRSAERLYGSRPFQWLKKIKKVFTR